MREQCCYICEHATTNTRALLGRCVCGYARIHHLYRPRMYWTNSSSDPQRTRLDNGSNGIRLLGVRVGVCAVRDSQRLAWRLDRLPAPADAHRPVVVVLHGSNRMGTESFI